LPRGGCNRPIRLRYNGLPLGAGKRWLGRD
jgi:hypothetical protein